MVQYPRAPPGVSIEGVYRTRPPRKPAARGSRSAVRIDLAGGGRLTRRQATRGGPYIYTVEPRYYVPRLQRFHPYNVHIPKSRISVMHYIFYRYRLQRTPLQRNFRYNVQISRKNMKNGLRYNVQRGSISAVKCAKLPANTCRSEQLA